MMSECPKIMKISKSSLYTLNGPKVALDPMRTSKNVFRMDYGCLDHFLTAVRGILMPKTRILTNFSCFLTILEGLNYWAARPGAAGVHKNPKKSKSPKIGLNTPKLS